MKRIKAVWCKIVGHDEFRMSIGRNYIDACLRCQATLHVHEEAK